MRTAFRGWPGFLLGLLLGSGLTAFLLTRTPQPSPAANTATAAGEIGNGPSTILPPTTLPSATPAIPLDAVLPSVAPTPVIGFGIMSDSFSDEYRADDNRGGHYAATTLNWVELLVSRRGLNFGAWGVWGEPRRTGYKYNWARSGATAHDLITSGQHTGLAGQVARGEVSYVFVLIGNNDFALWNGTYDEIYDGRLSGDALQAKIDGIVADITTAVDTVLNAGQVKMIMVTLADAGIAPDTVASSPEPAKRRRVTDAINQVNARITEMATARGIVVVDANSMLVALDPQIDENGNLHVGNEQIALFAKGDEPHHGRLGDGSGHAGTVLSAYIANLLFIEPFNTYYRLNIAPLSDTEILADAGLLPAP